MSVQTVTQTNRSHVVERAMMQIGKPYAWAAAGPDAYDCSGSALAAWHGYVDLPHNTSAMVVSDQLQARRAGVKIDGHWPRYYLLPGDLIFYYGDILHPSTVSHVAVFVGDGKIVNATGIVDGVNRGVELLTIDQYARPCGFGFVRHAPGAK